MKEFEDILSRIAIVGILALLIALTIRIIYLTRTRGQRESLLSAPTSVVALRMFLVTGLIATAIGSVSYLFVLLRGSTFMPSSLKLIFAALLLSWIAIEITAAFRPKLPLSTLARTRAVVGSFLVCALGFFLVSMFRTASAYPEEGKDILINVPFEGEWVATGSGATSATNHHNRIPSQRYAIDIAKACDDGRLFTGEGKELEESCTFGAIVLSPVNGIVSYAVKDLPDIGSKSELAGNHVVIQIADNKYVAIAHLQQSSITVSVGDTVVTGQLIGKAGNSGNSDFPHLHIHVQDSPEYDIRESVSIPFMFTNAEVKRYLLWKKSDAITILSNDRIRNRVR